jgi:hypothetical protein
LPALQKKEKEKQSRKEYALALRNMQIKITMRVFHNLSGTYNYKDMTTSVGEDVEKLKPSYIAGKYVKWCCQCGKSGSS